MEGVLSRSIVDDHAKNQYKNTIVYFHFSVFIRYRDTNVYLMLFLL